MLRAAITSLLLLSASGCAGNNCLHLCQEYELYLDECGYGWSTAFAEEGWVTLDDCYDDHWEPSPSEDRECLVRSREVREKECF